MIPKNQGLNLSNHVDLFVASKGTDKYICPICGGNDLSIHKSNGKYNCFSSSGDCNTEIYKFVIDSLGIINSSNNQHSPKFNPTKVGIDFYSSDLLSTASKSTYEDLINYQSGKIPEVRFSYQNLEGEQCYVIRKAYADGAKSKPHTVKDGQLRLGKLDEAWYPFNYRSFPLAKGKSILFTEGEKDAIIAQYLIGILAICLACGGNEYEQKLLILELQKAGIISGIYFYDNDKAGKNKAVKLKAIADKLGFDLIIIPITELYPNCHSKADIADYFLDENISDYLKSKCHLESVVNKFKNEQCSTVTSFTDKDNNDNHKDKKRVVKTDAIDEVREILVNKYSERLKYNELKRIVELDGEEAYLDDFYLKIHKDYGIKISKQIAYDLTVMVAKENSYHPVKDYLNNLQEDSQEIDIKNLSSLFFGTTNKLYDEMIYRHLIGSVARVFKQGCKLDTALILQGKQGIGKSTFFNVLYGNEFFTDSVTGTDRDNLLILHQHWCSELAEFESITGKKASGELKAFLSKSVDTFREPYGRSSRTVKRQSVIVGSVNECEFLVDSTGNRRFWVIPIDQSINLETVKKHRDVIWYQAKKAFLEGEKWYLDYKYQKESEELNKQYLHTDSWDSLDLDNYLSGFEEIGISVRDILVSYLKFEEHQIKRSDEMRMSKILISKSWFKKQQFIKGKKMNKWFLANFEKKVSMVGMVGITLDNKGVEYLPTSYQPQKVGMDQEKVGMDQKNENLAKYTNLPTSNNGYTNLNEEVGSSETLINKETYQPTNLYQPFSQTTSKFANLIQNDEINLPTNLEQKIEKNDSEKNQSNLNDEQNGEDKKNIADVRQESNKQEIDFNFMVQKIDSYLESRGLTTKNDKHSFIENQIKRSYKNLTDLTDQEILDLYALAIV